MNLFDVKSWKCTKDELFQISVRHRYKFLMWQLLHII